MLNFSCRTAAAPLTKLLCSFPTKQDLRENSSTYMQGSNTLLAVGCLLFAWLSWASCGNQSAEKQAESVKEISIEPEVIQLPAKHYLVLRERLPLDHMDGFFGIEFPILLDKAKAAGIQPTGPISALFYEWNTESGIGEAAVALPVPADSELPGYVLVSFPPTRAFTTDLEGPYTGLNAIYYGLEAQFKLQGLTIGLPTIEEYIRGPLDSVAEASFLTRVIYPIAE